MIDRIDTEEFYFYEGSFTTPNCTEDVEWLIFYEPLYISAEQVDLIHEKWMDNKTFSGYEEGNIRKTQPLNERKIYKSHSFAY